MGSMAGYARVIELNFGGGFLSRENFNPALCHVMLVARYYRGDLAVKVGLCQLHSQAYIYL